MKIIGERRDGIRRTLLLEASEDEAANLIGHYYANDEARAKLKTGAEIAVAAMFRQLHRLQESRGQLGKVAETLRGLAGLLEVNAPVIDAAARPADSSAEAK